MTKTVQTPFATITRTDSHRVEIHFTPGVALNKAAITEVIHERKHLCGNDPVGLLLIIPPDCELDLSVIGTDHLKVNEATDRVLCFAVVAGNAVSETLLRLYKAYYPTAFRSEVFTDEDEARAWLDRHIASALDVGKN